jgi:hypothetical protein
VSNQNFLFTEEKYFSEVIGFAMDKDNDIGSNTHSLLLL